MRRIIEDVMALPRVLEVIIAARGCVVQDEEFRDLRHGRRGEGVGSKGRKKRPLAQPDLTGDRAVALKVIKDETIELDKAFATNTKTQKAAH